MLHAESELCQTDARGVLVTLLFNFSTGRLCEDVFTAGSFTEHWFALLSKRGEKDLHAILFVCAFALASCEAHFMMLGVFVSLSCLRSGL